MRLTIVDDSTLFREGLVRVARDLGFEIVGQAGDAQSLVDLIRADPPDVAVLDIRMPRTATSGRSEEHTSELQSQSNLVCRLLLEKKKTIACSTPIATHVIHL